MSIPTDPAEARLLFRTLSALEAQLGLSPTVVLDPVGSWQFAFATCELIVYSDPFHRDPTVRIELFHERNGKTFVQQWLLGDPTLFDMQITDAATRCIAQRSTPR